MGNGKVVPVHVMKAWREGGVQLQLHSFLTSALDASDQLHAPAASFPERMQVSNMRLGGPQRRCGRFWKRANLLSLPEFEPPGSKLGELLLRHADGRINV
jgi:hypothetical protein